MRELMKRIWAKSGNEASILLTAFLIAVFAGLGIACADVCPSLLGFEDFGDANQPANDVSVVGNLVFSADSFGLTIYDISSPDHPQELGESLLFGTGKRVSVSGNKACVVTNYGNLEIFDVSDPTNPIHLEEIRPQYRPFKEVVAWNNFVYVTEKSDIDVYDVSGPSQPISHLSLHLDMITDIAFNGEFFFVACSEGLVIIDFSDPSHPVRRGVLDTWGEVVGVEGNIAVVGTEGTLGPPGTVEIVDVSNPDLPRSVGSYSTPGIPTSIRITNQHACIAEGNTLELLDLSNPSEPLPVSSTEMDTPIETMTVNGNQLYTCLDELGLRILDLSDPGQPEVLGAVHAEGDARALAISDGIAFVADGRFGLQIVDITDPNNPTLLSGLRLPGQARGIALSGNSAFVADGSEGLTILNVSDLLAPEIIGNYDSPGEAFNVVVSGDRAFLADGSSGLEILDVHDPSAPKLLGTYNPESNAVDLASSEDLVFLVLKPDPWLSDPQLQIIDVSDAYHPSALGRIFSNGQWGFGGVGVSGDLVVLTDTAREALKIYDVSEPATPIFRGDLYLGFWLEGLEISGDSVYVATTANLEKFSFADPSNPVLISETQTRKSSRNVVLDPLTHTAWLTEGSILEGINVGCAECSLAEIQVDPPSISTGGALSTMNLYLSDFFGNPAPGQVVEGRSDLGVLSDFDDQGDGNYRATLSSGNLSGPATIRISINGERCSSTTTVMILCASGAVPPPDTVEAQVIDKNSVQVDWGSVPGAAGYELIRDTSVIRELGPQSTAWVDAGLASGTSYSYVVASKDSCGGSWKSDEFRVRTPGSAPICPVQGLNYPEVDSRTLGSFSVVGDMAYVLTRGGLEILDVSEPNNVELIGEWREDEGGDFDAYHVIVSDGIAYAFGDLLYIFDVSNPQLPTKINTVELGDVVYVAGISDNKMYVVYSFGVFSIFDLTLPGHPVLLGTADTSIMDIQSLLVSGDYLYLSGDWPGMEVFDVSDPAQPKSLSLIPIDAGAFLKSSGYLYVSGSEYFQAIDISDAAHPILGDRIHVGGKGACLYGAGRYAALPGLKTISSVDLSNPGHPVLARTIQTSSIFQHLESTSTTVFGLHDGLQVFTMDNCVSLVLHPNSLKYR